MCCGYQTIFSTNKYVARLTIKKLSLGWSDQMEAQMKFYYIEQYIAQIRWLWKVDLFNLPWSSLSITWASSCLLWIVTLSVFLISGLVRSNKAALQAARSNNLLKASLIMMSSTPIVTLWHMLRGHWGNWWRSTYQLYKYINNHQLINFTNIQGVFFSQGPGGCKTAMYFVEF